MRKKAREEELAAKAAREDPCPVEPPSKDDYWVLVGFYQDVFKGPRIELAFEDFLTLGISFNCRQRMQEEEISHKAHAAASGHVFDRQLELAKEAADRANRKPEVFFPTTDGSPLVFGALDPPFPPDPEAEKIFGWNVPKDVTRAGKVVPCTGNQGKQ
jgi:hypothetical protein